MAEQRAEDDIDHMLGGEFLHHLAGTLGVGGVILDNELHGASADTAHIVDHLDGGHAGAFIPIAVSGADAGAMRLQADLDGIVGGE
jgi:hypothetical protein